MANGTTTLPDDDPLASAVLEAARPGGPRVLVLGGGPGSAANELVRAADKQVTLVDPDDVRLESAAEQGIDRAIRATVGDLTWVERVLPEQFEIVVISDTLADLAEVERVLGAVGEHDLLADGGHLVITLPMEDVEKRSGTTEHPTSATDWSPTELQHRLEAQGFTASRVLRPMSDAGEATHLVVCVGVLESRALDALRTEIDRLRSELEQCERRRKRALGKRDDERRRADDLQARLDAIHASRTWRVGRLLVSAPGAVKSGLRPRR